MKNFVKLIQQVHAERFSVVISKILAKKIPVAFLSLEPIAQAVETAKNFRAQNLNIITLITMDTIRNDSDFEIFHVNDAAKIYPQPEYIFTDDLTAARVAVKNFHASKVISLGNITNRIGDIVYANTPHYICAGFIPERGAIVIDGGLCDGGTALRFSKMGYKVYGFEADKTNYMTARKVGEENNFVVENLGLGAYNHTAKFSHYPNPGASRIDPNGTETAQIVTLDSYVREKNLPRVDFIKLDVEGAELDVLKGAATTIARDKPILALSAYHKWDDFWTLMNFVKSLRPDYEFALRQFVISKEDGAYHFHKGVEEYLESLGLRPAIAGFQECVLFAR